MNSIRKSLSVLVAAIALFMPQLASADVNDFSFESFDATYSLSVNEQEQNRPEMQVTETLVALFPEIDQNRGIKRSLPSSSYGDNPGLIEVQSVTDGNGYAREYEVIEGSHVGLDDFVCIASLLSIEYNLLTIIVHVPEVNVYTQLSGQWTLLILCSSFFDEIVQSVKLKVELTPEAILLSIQHLLSFACSK
jgi:hypothetical protein